MQFMAMSCYIMYDPFCLRRSCFCLTAAWVQCRQNGSNLISCHATLLWFALPEKSKQRRVNNFLCKISFCGVFLVHWCSSKPYSGHLTYGCTMCAGIRWLHAWAVRLRKRVYWKSLKNGIWAFEIQLKGEWKPIHRIFCVQWQVLLKWFHCTIQHQKKIEKNSHTKVGIVKIVIMT